MHWQQFNKAKRRSDIKRVVWITIFWTLAGVLRFNYNYASLYSGMSLGPSSEFSYQAGLTISLIASAIAGLAGGYILIFLMRIRFRDKPYGYNLAFLAVIFPIVYFSIYIPFNFFYYSLHYDLPLLHPVVANKTLGYLTQGYTLVDMTFWALVLMGTQLILQISDKFGPGMFTNFLLGRYAVPREENRVFLFMDLKSSTSIAEKIGHLEYYKLLNDIYRDITDAIIYSRGEIYQYIGDEIVISWKMEKGIKENACLECFFNIKSILQEKSSCYQDKYGVVPHFKAGMHCGKVTVGEMGVIKKDIAYSGDVLNTTSRIQETCNEFDTDMLCSSDLLHQLLVSDAFDILEQGNIQLRGKTKQIQVFTIQEKKQMEIANLNISPAVQLH